MVGRPSWRVKSGQEAIPDGWDGLGSPPSKPGGVRRPSSRARSSQEALPVGGRTFGKAWWVRRLAGRWEAIPEGLEGWDFIQEG